MENRSAKVQTYLKQLAEGNIRGNQMEVLDWIYKHRGTTIHEMRTELSMAHQSLTPAISNLLDCGLIREVGQEHIKDSVYSKYEFEPDATEQNILYRDRQQNKFRQWIKMGLREYEDLMLPSLIEELYDNQ